MQPPTNHHAKRAANYYAPNQNAARPLRYGIEIDPANASFYVTENGVPIARFNNHHKATSFVLARLWFPEPNSDGFQPADKLFQEQGGAL
jgi:hypothetical protein